jgi:adenylate kinase
VRNRLNVYATQTEPLLQHYRNRSRLVSVSGEGSIESIRATIRQALAR